MKLLLLGSTGQIGTAIRRLVPEEWQVTAWSRADLDFSDTAAVRKKLNELARHGAAPDFIVNAAAYTKVDLAESNPVEATRLNVDLPKVLAEAAKAWGARLVHYSTDYVYSGEAIAPYREGDAAEPVNLYGKTKLLGDQAIMASSCDYLIFRTSWVFGTDGRNFLLTILQHAREKSELRVVSDQVGAPTFADDIAGSTIEAMKLALAMPIFPSGVYHLTNSGETSWHGFAEAIVNEAKRAGMTLKASRVVPIQTREYPTPARRPASSRLDLQKIATVFAIRPRSWTEAMKEAIATIAREQR